MSVITISRQYGAGGRTIGEKIAQKLNYSFFDNELIQMVAEKANVSEHTVKTFEKEKFGDRQISHFEDRYPWFLGIAWLLLLIEWIL